MKKYYIKKNIIGFIVGVILCMGTFVYAAVTFPSNEVTYDNTESGLSSTNVKGAIDELYTECTKEPTAGDHILEDQPLEKDEYECRYFFKGANPNNYITFNGENAGWRIISVECDGRIKIMKTAWITDTSWDTSNNNNWARPASLNTYLNSTYYNNLDSTAKNQIVSSNFSIGAVTWDNNNMSTQVSNENSTLWKGQVALPTMSEYLRTNSNKSSCGTLNLYNDNAINCVSTGWMDSERWWWTLTPRSGYSYTVLRVDANALGSISGAAEAYSSGGVRPTLYLSSEVKLSGSGTQSDPYVVS